MPDQESAASFIGAINPFHFNPAGPNEFVGRWPLVRELAGELALGASSYACVGGRRFGKTSLLSMVRHICDRVAVMYLGKIVELGQTDEVYDNPLHPYTQALLSAVPIPDPIAEAKRQRVILTGDVPSPARPPIGCNFNTRCPVHFDLCHHDPDPPLIEALPGHWVACHRVTP